MEKYNRFSSIKTLLYSDRIWEIVKGNFPAPVIWHVYPTNLCCLNCSFCIMKQEKVDRESLPKSTLNKLVGDLASMDVKTVHFSGGGEPLMHPDILDTMIKIKQQTKVKIALSTNGVHLTSPIASLVDYLRISLNAGTANTHAYITESHRWYEIIDNIASLDDEAKKKTGLGFVVTHQNWHEIDKFCELAARLKVAFVHIRPAYLPEHNQEILLRMPAIQGVAIMAQQLYPHLQVHFVISKFDGYWSERVYDKCRATPLIAVLKASGMFSPCQDRFDIAWGDYNTESFAEIWQSEEHEEAISKIELNDCPRCVETKKNEYIHQLFVNDESIRDLL